MEYRCRKLEGNITIDGNLEKPEWKAAEEAVLVDAAAGGRVRNGTTVKLLWSDEYLYAGFSCEDDYICATMTEYNDRLYEEDVIEIFIDDDRDLKTYIEVEVNPLNAVLHYEIHNNLNNEFIQFARIRQTVISAVSLQEDGRGFSVELAIPFGEFVTAAANPPRGGDRWLFNLYRIDRAKDGGVEYSAWSPTGKINFHLPHKFGELVFED